MEQKPATLNEALDRLRDPSRSTEQHFSDFADAIEILVCLGMTDLDKRDLDTGMNGYRD